MQRFSWDFCVCPSLIRLYKQNRAMTCLSFDAASWRIYYAAGNRIWAFRNSCSAHSHWSKDLQSYLPHPSLSLSQPPPPPLPHPSPGSGWIWIAVKVARADGFDDYYCRNPPPLFLLFFLNIEMFIHASLLC